jgi:hypothetical protein
MHLTILPILLATCFSLSADSFHHDVEKQKAASYSWEVKDVSPFNQLIVSWNGEKPKSKSELEEGSWKISIQLFQNGDWSTPFDYVTWGSKTQGSFDTAGQDTIDIAEGISTTGFRVFVSNFESGKLYCLHAYTKTADQVIPESFAAKETYKLEVMPLSQIALNHPISKRICSPTSTLAVVRYLHKEEISDPIAFAQSVYDIPCDIYGNWILNVAGASDLLGEKHRCWVERNLSFQTIIDQLEKGFPSVISVKGTIRGASMPYVNGHLLVVTGFDPVQKKVFVMDPAFEINEQTVTSYALDDLLAAWKSRGNTAYLFSQANLQ